ncbi:hypothetical protein ACLB1E_24335 [Escherichia coli]
MWSELQDGEWIAYPDTLVGTYLHTTMINGLACWGGRWWHRSKSRMLRPAGFQDRGCSGL